MSVISHCVSLEITGRTPIMPNRFPVDEVDTGKDHEGSSKRAKRDFGTPQEQAERGVYRSTESGVLYLPAEIPMASWIYAGRDFKFSGNRQVSTSQNTILPGYVDMEELIIPLRHPTTGKPVKDFEVDSRFVRVSNRGIVRHRAKINEWMLRMTVNVDADFGIDLFRDIVEFAGRRVGLCDFRPTCKGWFGKSDITKWSVKKQAARSAA